MCSPFHSPPRLRCFLLGGFLLAFGSGCQQSKLLETAPMNARPELIAASRQSGASGRAMQNPYEDNDYAMTEGQRLTSGTTAAAATLAEAAESVRR